MYNIRIYKKSVGSDDENELQQKKIKTKIG